MITYHLNYDDAPAYPESLSGILAARMKDLPPLAPVREGYCFEGWYKDGKARLVLDNVNIEPFSGYVWEYDAPTMKECADAFLAAPIWDGKEFLQVESEVEWTEWWDEPSGS